MQRVCNLHQAAFLRMEPRYYNGGRIFFGMFFRVNKQGVLKNGEYLFSQKECFFALKRFFAGIFAFCQDKKYDTNAKKLIPVS